MKVTIYIADRKDNFFEIKDAILNAVHPYYMVFDSLTDDSVPYMIGETIWVHTDNLGLIPCIIDKPHHFVCNSIEDCVYENYFDVEDVGKTIFRSQKEYEVRNNILQ